MVDAEVCRAWSGGAAVWLDDDPTLAAMTAVFSRMTATAVNERESGARWIPGTAPRILI
jgi:hypothetical protein